MSEPIKKPQRTPESYIPQIPEIIATTVAYVNDSNTLPQTANVTFNGSIETSDLPLVPHANAFPSAVMSLGVLMGLEHDTYITGAHNTKWRADRDYNLHYALSGEGFRFMFNTVEYFRFNLPEGAEPSHDCFAAIETPIEIYSRHDVLGINGSYADDDELTKLVAKNIAVGYPVLVLTEADRVLLATGYEQNGETLKAWAFISGESDRNKSFTSENCEFVSEWQHDVVAVVLVKGIPKRPLKDNLCALIRSALKRGERFLREQQNAPHNEQICWYDSWIAKIRDTYVPSVESDNRAHIHPEIWDLAERRMYMAWFFEYAAELFGTDKFAPAIEAGTEIHTLMWRINALFNEKRNDKVLLDAVVISEIIDIINRCRQLDIQMADSIATAMQTIENRL